MSALGMLSAIAFDPTIRGIMVVVVSSVLWFGSLYLILLTNTGVKLGFLLAGSGLFAWCFLMGIVWTIYGIGLIGRTPAWMITDLNYDRATEITGSKVLEELPAHADLPDPEAMLEKYPLLHALALGAEGEDFEPESITIVKTIVQPWTTVSTRDAWAAGIAAQDRGAAVLDDNPEVAALVANGGTALRDRVREDSVALRKEIQAPLGDWCLLTESDPRRGEAQASADAAFAAQNAFPGSDGATDTTDYLIQNVFLYGGKEPCDPIIEESSLKQAWHRVATTFQVKNPKMYAAATAIRSVEHPQVAGQAPPPAEIRDDAGEVTVGMLRNLGNKRFIPFMFAVVSFIGFVIFTTMLHFRDKEAMAVRAAFSGAGKGK